VFVPGANLEFFSRTRPERLELEHGPENNGENRQLAGTIELASESSTHRIELPICGRGQSGAFRGLGLGGDGSGRYPVIGAEAFGGGAPVGMGNTTAWIESERPLLRAVKSFLHITLQVLPGNESGSLIRYRGAKRPGLFPHGGPFNGKKSSSRSVPL